MPSVGAYTGPHEHVCVCIAYTDVQSHCLFTDIPLIYAGTFNIDTPCTATLQSSFVASPLVYSQLCGLKEIKSD